jgi:hypothetical protein
VGHTLEIDSNIEAPVWAKNKATLGEMSLLVIPRLHMNYSVKSVDGLCCQLSLAQAGKRSQRIEPGGDLLDAPSMNRGRTASVAGQKGLQ